MKQLRRWSGVTALLIAFTLMGAPAGAQDYPVTTGTLDIPSSTVSPGSVTTISGGGCAPGSTVSVALGGSSLGSTTATAAGDFSTQVEVPESASSGTMEASCETTDGGTLVLGVQVTVEGSELAFTGTETWVFASVGTALALAGGVVMLMVRRSRTA